MKKYTTVAICTMLLSIYYAMAAPDCVNDCDLSVSCFYSISQDKYYYLDHFDCFPCNGASTKCLKPSSTWTKSTNTCQVPVNQMNQFRTEVDASNLCSYDPVLYSYIEASYIEDIEGAQRVQDGKVKTCN